MPDRSPLRTIDWFAILTALVLPSAITWIYFYRAASADAETQRAVYAVAKAVQFALPVFWIVVVQRSRGRMPKLARSKEPPSRGGTLAVAVAFGAVVAAAMFGLYFGWLRGSALLAAASSEIAGKVSGWGIGSVWQYAALGLFYSLIHSLLEEYYWRWFVFGQLRRGAAFGLAAAVSSLGFMAHHVLVLGRFFGFGHWATWLFSACVAVGGAVWAWLYEQSGSIRGPWLSHLLVDAAIFAIGYDLVRTLF